MADLQRIVFQEWPKIGRLKKDMMVTEKIDGTNAAVGIVKFQFGHHANAPKPDAGKLVLGPDNNDFAHGGDGLPDDEYIIYAQSRRRLITPGDDNYGFASWVWDNAAALVELLGPGLHFGEWWGQGIQRGYGLDEKRFSLFNAKRWGWLNYPPQRQEQGVDIPVYSVPILRMHTFSTHVVRNELAKLAANGSVAAPGFMNPEGVVVYHTATQSMYKATVDDAHKGAA